MELMFWMQVIGSGLRFISSFLWCQMYRLGAISGTSTTLQPVDFDVRNAILGDESESEVLGGSIYDRAAFSSLLESFSREDDLDIEVTIIHHALFMKVLLMLYLQTVFVNSLHSSFLSQNNGLEVPTSTLGCRHPSNKH